MRASTIILEPHIPLGGFLGMMGGARPKPSITLSAVRASRRRGMGEAVPVSVGTQVGNSAGAMVGAPNTPIPTYDPTLADLWNNMWTGNLTPDEVSQLQAQESAELQQAGMPASQAQTQAASDVNATLATFNAPGAFGISWTGAQPGAGPTGALGSLFSGIPTWALVGLCGVGILIVVKEIL